MHKLRMSGSKLWLSCPGSHALQIAFNKPGGDENPAALEGSRAHKCVSDLVSGTYKECDYPQEMADHARDFLDFLRDYGIFEFEQNVGTPTYEIAPGTADAIQRQQRIVVDYKYGVGNLVFADENTQLMSYAATVNHTKQWTGIIYQPRREHVSIATYSPEQLMRHRARMIQTAREIASGNAPRIPGDHCQYCKGRAHCPELQQHFAQLGLPPTDGPQFELAHVSPVGLANVLDNAPILRAYLDAAEDLATERAIAGVDIPGYAIGNGRAANVWADEGLVAEILGEDAFEKKLISPAKAKTFLGKSFKTNPLVENINRIEGKPKLKKVREVDLDLEKLFDFV